VTNASDWTFADLVQYYDANTDVLPESARRLAALGAADKECALAQIAATVQAHIAQLRTDGIDIARVAVSAADDLYKTLFRAQEWSPESTAYLRAVFGTFLAAASSWGIQVRYVVENTFPDYLDRPLIFYPEMFRQAGFIYVCPHEFAWRLAEHDGLLSAGQDPTIGNLAPLSAEGRTLAHEAARRAVTDGRHLAYFEIDWQPGSLDPLDALPAPPGTVIVFRNDVPAPGTTVEVRIVNQ
jgi:hypothetical protein